MNIARAAATVTLTVLGLSLATGISNAAVENPAPAITAPADTATPVHEQHDPQADFNDAVGVAANEVGLAATAGAIGGTAVGATIGCPIGAITAGFTALPTGPIAIPAAALGCIAGAGIGVGLGAAIGTTVVAGPVGVASAVRAYNTLHAAGDVAAAVPVS